VAKQKLVKEVEPAHGRHEKEFIEMGGKGDETLYSDEEGGSRYATDQNLTASKDV
jgi:serine/threonine-protein kinase Chk2